MAKKTKKRRKATVKRRKTVAKRRKTVKRKKVARRKTGARRKSGLSQTTYGLSPALEAVVGHKRLTRPQIVKYMWVYIKAHKCQDAKNRRMINPDKKLAEVIGSRPVDMLKLAGHLNKHIKK